MSEQESRRRDPQAETMVRHFGAVAHATRIHAVTNRAVARLFDWLIQDLNSITATRGEFRFELDGSYPFMNGAPIRASREQRAQLSSFYELIRVYHSGGFRLKGPASRATLAAYFDGVREPHADRAAFQAYLNARGAQNIELLPPRKLVSGSVAGKGHSVRVAASDALRGYVRTVAAIESSMKADNIDRIPAQIYKAVQELVGLAAEEPDHHLALTSIKEDIDFKLRHPANVAILAIALAHRLGIHRSLQVELGFIALIAGSLCTGADDTTRLMVAARQTQTPKMTPARARRMLALYEHGLEHYQGTHLFSRIIAIVMAYDRLTTQHGDHAGLLADEALARLQQERRLDPDLLRVFSRVIGRYPLGSVVRLSSGELAVVYHSPADPAKADRPVVRVIRDPAGQAVSRIVDLAVDPRQIVGMMDRALAGLDDSMDFFR